MKKYEVIVKEYNGGKYGRTGEYRAIVIPKFFKNGKMKKSGFVVCEYLETIKKGYGYGNCNHSEVIDRIIKEIED